MDHAVALFTIRLIVGISWFCFRLGEPRQQVVSPYFRIQMLLLLGLGVLFGLAGAGAADRLWALVIGGTAFVGSVLWTLERRPAGRWAFLGIELAGIYWLATTVSVLVPAPLSARLLLGASSLASAATLGSAMSAMLLGHRYLTAPGMPLAPLHWANSVFGLAALVRLAVSAWALIYAGQILGNSTYVIWLALRWLGGIFGPLVVWYMVQRILIYRNTQSATGVLFVGVILTFIGELTADVLFRAAGTPF